MATVGTSIDVAANIEIYSAPQVASHYASLNYLSPCERLIFDAHLRPEIDILDLGVGGGRTTPYLSKIASRYVGADYSEAMIRACRAKYPENEFLVADAANLSMFPESSFDAVVFSFNGIDYLRPLEKRMQCLRECWRVLRPGGKLIFSSHNPRAIFVIRSWNPQRVKDFSYKLAGKNRLLYALTVVAATIAKAGICFLRTFFESLVRIARRVPRKTFFAGEGYMWDPAHGGLMTRYGVPCKIIAELQELQFELIQFLGDDYPRESHSLISDWYYYVFAKPANKT
jgi:ubiquinone/menaquinone biosynthesis C-methylase UbiE